MTMFFKNFLREEAGQDLIEYSLLLAFLALFGVGMYTQINGSLNTIWTNANTTTTLAATTSAS